jgi:hypothetical protein
MPFRPSFKAALAAFGRAVTTAATVVVLAVLLTSLLRSEVGSPVELVSVALLLWPVAALYAAFFGFVPFVLAVSLAVRMPRVDAIWFVAWGAVAPQLVMWGIAGAPDKLPSWQSVLFYALPGALGGLAAWSRLRR